MTDVIITQADTSAVIITENNPNVITQLFAGPQGVAGPQGEAGEAFIETNPVFTYVDGLVSRIDYSSGNYKLFSYVLGVLTQLDYIQGATTVRKTFDYNPDGTLASITETVI